MKTFVCKDEFQGTECPFQYFFHGVLRFKCSPAKVNGGSKAAAAMCGYMRMNVRCAVLSSFPVESLDAKRSVFL